MKKIFFLIVLAFCSACNVKTTPIANTHFHEIDFTQVHRFEVAKSCKRYLFGVIPILSGQASIINAAKNGNLAKIYVADYEQSITLLPPGTKSCLIAYGKK